AEAGEAERAAAYWRKAGELAVRRAANREAMGHFRRALALVETQAETAERWRIELAILSQLAPPTMAVHGWSAVEVGEVVERAAEIGRRLPSSLDIAPAVANLWIFNAGRGRIDRAEEISNDLFRIARELDDPDILLQANHCAWATQFFRGRFREANEHILAGAAIYDLERHAHHRHLYLGHDPRVCSMNFGAAVQLALGYPDQGRKLAQEGIELAQRLDHPPTLANALWRACEAFIHLRDIDALTPTARELIELSDTYGLPMPRAYALGYLGWSRVYSGDVYEGLAHMAEAERVLVSIGALVHATLTRGLHAEALLAAGQYAEALQQAERALATAEQAGEWSYLSRLHRCRALAIRKLNGANEPEVEALLRRAMDVARQQSAKGWEIGAATDLARLWTERGRRVEAYNLLAPVYSWFTEGFETVDLKEAKALLDKLA
ncbi:MAG TPA: hypothetical protein VME45_16910, partial [Stellaceae bacterium]|nr:hypothetical protein [Stellaceae bacterium]